MEPLVIFFTAIVVSIVLFFTLSFFKNLAILYVETKHETKKRERLLRKQNWW